MPMDRGFHVDLFGDADTARRVLNREPITVVPFGTVRRGGVRNIDEAVASEFVDNWTHRATRGIRRSHLAVDINHEGGAVGWYHDVMLSAHGVDATFQWNQRGRRALEGGEYAYFSPSVYWDILDRVTGEMIHNQLGGGGLTNYPYFGDDTALFGGPASIWYAITKNEDDGCEYPARAYLVVEDGEQPRTWNLRVYSWRDGELQPDSVLLHQAEDTLNNGPYQDAPRASALRKLAEIQTMTGGSNMEKEQQGNLDVEAGLKGFAWLMSMLKPSMPVPVVPVIPPADPPGAGDQFTALQAQLDALQTQLTAEKAEHSANITALQSDLATEQGRTATIRFAVLAEQFEHLPGEADALAQQLRWLYTADTEDNSPHAAFFMELLGKADAEFAVHFAEKGVQRGAEAKASSQIDEAVADYRKDHPAASYEAALGNVMTARPELYAAYNAERAARVRAGGVR